MIKDKRDIEREIRASDSLEEVRSALLNLLEIIDEPTEDYATSKELELAEERISNTERCLSDNEKKLDISALRL